MFFCASLSVCVLCQHPNIPSLFYLPSKRCLGFLLLFLPSLGKSDSKEMLTSARTMRWGSVQLQSTVLKAGKVTGLCCLKKKKLGKSGVDEIVVAARMLLLLLKPVLF